MAVQATITTEITTMPVISTAARTIGFYSLKQFESRCRINLHTNTTRID